MINPYLGLFTGFEVCEVFKVNVTFFGMAWLRMLLPGFMECAAPPTNRSYYGDLPVFDAGAAPVRVRRTSARFARRESDSKQVAKV